MMSYELFDIESGNFVGSYSSVEDAYRAVRDGHREFGEESMHGLALFEVGDKSHEMLVAGNDLLLAALSFPVPAQRSA